MTIAAGNVTERVPIDRLRDADSPRRAGVDPAHVRLLAELDEGLPPITVHRATMRVIDGMHRLHAARLNHRETVEVTYFDGSERESFVLAVEANTGHGLPLTLADRRESAKRILRSYPEWSDRAIAAKVGLSGKTVGAIRRSDAEEFARAAVRVGRDGRVRPLSTVEGRLKARAVLAHRPDASLREIARIAGISVETARDVRDRLSLGEGALPGGLAGGLAAAGEAAPRLAPGRQPQTQTPQTPQKPQKPQTQTRPAGPIDPVAILDSLRRDPTIKYSAKGRALVRWLEARIVRSGESDAIRRAPAHQAEKIAALARACAACWNDIASEMEHRAVGD
jgi:hypothetical protein